MLFSGFNVMAGHLKMGFIQISMFYAGKRLNLFNFELFNMNKEVLLTQTFESTGFLGVSVGGGLSYRRNL